MIIELLREEIRNLYPRTVNTTAISEEMYIVHCSKGFARALYKNFMSIGFQIPAHLVDEGTKELEIKAVQEGNIRFTKYQIPNIGYIKVYADIEQGYKIEKI